MPFAALIGGTIAPALLMLSPFAVMAASDCADWKPAAKAVKGDKDMPCKRPRLPLM
ncbi:hypothetical protein KRZ98_14395 [Sphingobium sp. AS12]|uniref:hypothetical protein n=1 Tax=Sphingobium sp. AS12 TaxID=2849495 RepID=UPI001C31CD8F|nr:hypothetical protein [Sphingobium sp. AS12]MBV2149459.1 hypothetical protein [Sphingobium sp. AS12]